MSIFKRKEELNEIKKQLLERKQKKTVTLSDKVNDFINWYKLNMYDIPNGYGYCTEEELRFFIDKMAVWYELRFPDYEVNRIIPSINQEPTKVSNEMFNENKYVNGQVGENSDVRILDWDEFYNTQAFIDSLPVNEKELFAEPVYSPLVYVDYNHNVSHMHLDSNGYITRSEKMEFYTKGKIKDKDLEGLHITDALNLLEKKGICLPSENEIEPAINEVKLLTLRKSGMLDAVMYRIIERGGKKMGPRRALLFAKEFGRDLSVPMRYGIDLADPGLRNFLNTYVKMGGSKDSLCYVGYFNKTSDKEKLNVVSIQDLLDTLHFTEEEDELHREMLSTLSTYKDQKEKESKEEVNRLRLQRRLEKSKSRNNK